MIQVLVAGPHLFLPLHRGGPRQLPGNGDDDGGDDDNDDPGDDNDDPGDDDDDDYDLLRLHRGDPPPTANHLTQRLNLCAH